MLVLSRKEGEQLVLPTLGIAIEVVRIQGKRTRLGIDAPPDVPVLRREIADLKSIEFTPDELTTTKKLADLSKAVRQGLNSSADALNLLHEHLGGDHAAQSLVLDVFRELRNLESHLDDTLDDGRNSPTPHALVIDRNTDERELLASCLRLGGFEVDVAADASDVLNYLSLHATPDFALVADDHDVAVLRREVGAELKLVGLGIDEASLYRSFSRPIMADKLVDELAREFVVAV